jgi:hypothetical protein
MYLRNAVHPVMAAAGDRTDCVDCLMGDHVIAETMFWHDPRAMLSAPLQTLLWQDAPGSAWFTFAQPSSQFASLETGAVDKVGIALDHNLEALLEALSVPVPSAVTPPASARLAERATGGAE